MNSLTSRFHSRMDSIQKKRRFRKAVKALVPSEFIHYPEPTAPGDYTRGLRLFNGEVFVENQFHNLDGSIWDYQYPSEYFFERFQAFDWMDDLASLGTIEAARKMRAWTNEWIERYGQGEGLGWRADLLGWRLIRLITHAPTLLAESSGVQSERLFETLGIQTNYLKLVAGDARDGLPRMVSHVAWLFSSLSLDSFNEDLPEVLNLIDQECHQLVDNGTLYFDSRNPEELSKVFSLLVWADQALENKGYSSGKYHDAALDVMGQCLRGLRFGGHRLLATQGGGYGDPDELDRALVNAQIVGSAQDGLIMGFQNLRLGQLNTFFDVDPPPSGREYEKSHASTLGIWVSEREEILVCSGGAPLQAPLVKRVEMQETASHSTVVVSDTSSSNLELQKDVSKSFTIGASIASPARVFDRQISTDDTSIQLQASHDGYVKNFGYTHQRKLIFGRDGLFFGGLDILTADTPQAKKRVNSLISGRKAHGIMIDIYFHLGPTIKPSLDNNGDMVSFESDAGNLWIFKQEGGRIDIVDSEYFHPDRLTSTPSKTIAIRSRLVDVTGYLSWSFQAYPKK